MTCVCSSDGGSPTFYFSTRPQARTEHACTECSRTIEKSERYERVRALWGDGMTTIKTCVYCLAIRELMEARLACFCWEHGTLWGDIYEALDDVDAPGLRMAVGRLVVESKQRQGRLMFH